MRNPTLISLLVALSLLVACGKDKATEEAEREGEAIALDFIAEGATKSVAEIEAAIAGGTAKDATFSCAHMANIDELEKSAAHKALAAKLRDLCTEKLPLAIIEGEVKAAEAARQAKPDEQVLSECYNARYETALGDLKEAGKLDAAKALVARFATACPGAK